MAFSCHRAHDIVDNRFPKENHAKPPKAGDETHFIRTSFIDSANWIAHAEAFVATEDECIAGLVCFTIPLSLYHGGETGVDKHVEPLRDSVEGDQVLDIEVLCNLESQLGIIENSDENTELIHICFVV